MTASDTIPASARAGLRRRMRAARRAIAGRERRDAEAAIVTHIRGLRQFRHARRIATFAAFDGEPELAALIARSARTKFYVPVIDRRAMRFAALAPPSRQRKNFFGIVQPREPRCVPAATLDLVLTPLVAFDDHGMRVGVGRGYYDRCFSFLKERSQWRRPKLLGVAFDCQRVAKLEPQDWDVPLWGIVTESGVQTFDPRETACATG